MSDIILGEDNFLRKYKNSTLHINNQKVVIMKVDKILPIITKRSYNFKVGRERDSLVSNIFIGTLDLEVFEDIDGLGKVYAAGYCILGSNPITFYLDKQD